MLLFSGHDFAVAADSVSTEDPGEIQSLGDAVTRGSIKGLLRYSGQYRDSNLHVTQDSTTPHPEINTKKKQQYSAAGGYLGYETAPWFNTSIGATVYTGLPFFAANNPTDRRGLGGLYEETGGQDAYVALGEAFIKYQTDEHRAVIGRQEIADYRYVSTSNIRMSPVTHSGITYENRSLDGFQFNAAYVTGQKDRNAFDFEDMIRSARVATGCGAVDQNGDCVAADTKKLIRGAYNPADFDFSGNYSGSDKAMPLAAVTYAGERLSFEAWDFYTVDFVNTLYLYGQYDFQPLEDSNLILTLAGQYTDQRDVGDHVGGEVDTWFYGVKVQAFYEGMTAFAAFNEVAYNENSYDGGTIFVRWGTPQMFNSFQVQDSELAGTKSFGIGLQYDFGRQGIIPGVLMRVRYADYNMPDGLHQIDARQDRAEMTFDARYSFEKTTGFGFFNEVNGLSILLRIAYNNYRTDYDFAAYKAVHGYEFDTVTDDFMDYRLYLDYKF